MLGLFPLSLCLQFALTCILIAVSTLSVQLAVLAWVRVFRAAPNACRMAQLADAELPHVLVQLPVCNEGYLALRVAAAACALDWPQRPPHHPASGRRRQRKPRRAGRRR